MEDADSDRPSGYRRHNTRPYRNTMYHAMAACRAAVGGYILSHRSESQENLARRAGISVLQLRALEYGEPVDFSGVKAVTRLIASEIGDEAAREVRMLYRALSRCIARIESADDEEP